MKDKLMTLQEFKSQLESSPIPLGWRKGQTIFNILDRMGYARRVQFNEGIDCFYNDDCIDEFIEKAYKYYKEDYSIKVVQREGNR